MKSFVAACAQFIVEPGNIKANIDKCCHWVEAAVKEYGAELVVVPESVTTGFTAPWPLEEFYSRLEPIPGAHTRKIQDLCRKLGVHLVFPLYEKGPEPGVIWNSSALIDDHGEILGVYRKTHPFPSERLAAGGWTTPGNEAVVVDTRLGKVGMIVCYDGDFPELSRVLAIKGAQIITRPSALLRSFEIWEMVNKARAYDNHVYILACNALGQDAGGNCYFGHSMVVSPIAQTLALARGAEEIIACTLNPDPIKTIGYGSRSPMIFDHLEDRNLLAYEGILQEAKSSFEPAKRIPCQNIKPQNKE